MKAWDEPRPCGSCGAPEYYDGEHEAGDCLHNLRQQLAEARLIARDLFWSDVPSEKIEEVAARVKRRLRLPPDAYIDWLED